VLYHYDFGVIRTLRKRQNLTIVQLAERSKLTFPTLASIETNKTMPALSSLHQIAEALGLSLISLLSLCRKTEICKSTAQLIGASNGSQTETLIKALTASHGEIRVFRIPGEKGTLTESQYEHGDVFELTYVLSGQIEVTVNNRKLQAGVNETLFFDGVASHTHEFLSAGELLIVHIPKNTISLHDLLK
jgi:transcriptional regulator with XRE-family HTH domain